MGLAILSLLAHSLLQRMEDPVHKDHGHQADVLDDKLALLTTEVAGVNDVLTIVLYLTFLYFFIDLNDGDNAEDN